jgi:hypothetical protein
VQVTKWLFALSAFLRRGGRGPLWATRLAGAGDGEGRCRGRIWRRPQAQRAIDGHSAEITQGSTVLSDAQSKSYDIRTAAGGL